MKQVYYLYTCSVIRASVSVIATEGGPGRAFRRPRVGLQVTDTEVKQKEGPPDMPTRHLLKLTMHGS